MITGAVAGGTRSRGARREVLDRVGDTESVLAVFLPAERPLRSDELRRGIEKLSSGGSS